MKCFTIDRIVVGVALGASLLTAAAATPAARADDSVQAGADWTWVHPTVKGAASAGWVRVRDHGMAQEQRHQTVASFRVETDGQGRQWVEARSMLKGAQGAGWVRVPASGMK